MTTIFVLLLLLVLIIPIFVSGMLLAFVALSFLFGFFLLASFSLFSVTTIFFTTSIATIIILSCSPLITSIINTISHAAIHNNNFLHGRWLGPFQFHVGGHAQHSVQSFNDLPKNNMLLIQMRCFLQGYKELTAIGVFPLVGHAHHTSLVVRHGKGFVGKGFAGRRYSIPARPTEMFKITSLDHKTGNDPMKDTSTVGGHGSGGCRTTRSGTQCGKILACFGTSLAKKLNYYELGRATSDGNLEETLSVDIVAAFLGHCASGIDTLVGATTYMFS